jgi:hypothetical protein
MSILIGFKNVTSRSGVFNGNANINVLWCNMRWNAWPWPSVSLQTAYRKCWVHWDLKLRAGAPILHTLRNLPNTYRNWSYYCWSFLQIYFSFLIFLRLEDLTHPASQDPGGLVTAICKPSLLHWYSRDSSAGIALGCGLDDRRSRVRFPGGGLGIFLFTTAPRTALEPTKPLIQWVPGALSLGVKRPGREADHSHLVPKSKNAWRYTCTSPIRLHGVVLS